MLGFRHISGLVLLLTACKAFPVEEELSRQKRVIGGEQYTKGEYPFHVSLWFMGDNPYTAKTPNLHHLCGGILIADSWVLTAGICFDDDVLDGFGNLTQWHAYLGMYAQTDAEKEAQHRQVQEVFFPDEYNVTEMYGDVVLLNLDRPAKLSDSVGVVKVNKDPDCPQVNQEVEIIGWGQTQNETYGLGSDVPHKAWVKATSVEYCHQQYYQPDILKQFAAPPRIDQGTLCAGLPQGGVDGCYGDSGSPVLASCGLDSSQVAVGLASYGYGCAQAGFPGVTTRLSAFSDWIAETMMNN